MSSPWLSSTSGHVSVDKWALTECSGSGTPFPSLPPTPGSLPLLGQCLTLYWEQKKLMAPGCEPLAVRRMMDVLAPHVHGQSLAGAGGGGFLYLLTKEPKQKEALEAVLAKTEVPGGVGGGTGALSVAHWLTRGYNSMSPWLVASGRPPGGHRFAQSPLPTSCHLLAGPWELQRPPGRSGHAGPEPAAVGE